MSESAFHRNEQGLRALQRDLGTAGARALADVWKVFRRWGQEYKRRVQRVIPVKYGLARQSMQVIEQNDGHMMTVTLGTSLKSKDGEPYPLYLEMGTEHIAGGRVQDWQEGDAPIMDWPAKMADITSLRGLKPGTAKHERAVNIAQRAFTAGQGEQMPFMRPVGYEIAPRVIEDSRVAIRDGFKAVMDGKRF